MEAFSRENYCSRWEKFFTNWIGYSSPNGSLYLSESQKNIQNSNEKKEPDNKLLQIKHFLTGQDMLPEGYLQNKDKQPIYTS